MDEGIACTYLYENLPQVVFAVLAKAKARVSICLERKLNALSWVERVDKDPKKKSMYMGEAMKMSSLT